MAAATAPRKSPGKVGYKFVPIPQEGPDDIARVLGPHAASCLVFLTMLHTLNPDGPDEWFVTREDLGKLLQITPQGVDKVIGHVQTCIPDQAGDLGLVSCRRHGKEGLALGTRRENLCRLRSLPDYGRKRLSTAEEREAKARAEEEARQKEIASQVEQRILAKAGELLCPRCGSEHTGLACEDCGAVTPVVRQDSVPPPAPVGQPVQKLKAARASAAASPPPQSTTPVVVSPTVTPVALQPETTTPVVLSVLKSLISLFFLQKFSRSLDAGLAGEILKGLGLDPMAPCSDLDRKLLEEYRDQFLAVDPKKHASGLCKHPKFIRQVLETFEEKRKLPIEGLAPPRPLSSRAAEVERVLRERQAKRDRGGPNGHR